MVMFYKVYYRMIDNIGFLIFSKVLIKIVKSFLGWKL